MLRLSFATAAQTRGAAPISNASAVALAHALLGGDSAHLSISLRADLGLFGWAIEHFLARENAPPESIDALARFVSEHALPLLSALDAFCCDRSSLDDSILTWSSRAPSIARLAVLLCDRPAFTPSCPHAAELHAFLLCWRAAVPFHHSSFIILNLASSIAFDLFTASTPPWSDERELLDFVKGTGNREQGTGGTETSCATAGLPVPSNVEGPSSVPPSSPTLPSAFCLLPSSEDFPLQTLVARLSAPATSETAKLESLAHFAAGAGHEMNNPLAVISGRAQLLMRDEQNPERRRDLATIHTQAMRVHEMIAGLMLFARPPAPRLAPCDLRDILDKALASLSGQIAELNVTIHRDISAAPVPLNADAAQLTLAFRAILENALQVSSNAAVHVTLETATDQATVTIRDSGPGIPPEVRPHIFDPFFSGASSGRGLGVGLSKAWRLLTNHHATIDVASPQEGGAEFKIVLRF